MTALCRVLQVTTFPTTVEWPIRTVEMMLSEEMPAMRLPLSDRVDQHQAGYATSPGRKGGEADRPVGDGLAVDHDRVEFSRRGHELAADENAVDAVVDGFDPVERELHGVATARPYENARTAIVGRQRVCDGDMAGRVRKKLDPVAGVIAHDAIGDRQREAGAEDKAGPAAEADTLDRNAAKVDIAIRRVDGNSGAAAGDENARLADAVVDDADRFRDRQPAIAAGIEHRDLTVGQGLAVCGLEGAARRGNAVAGVGVVATGSGHEGAGGLRLRGIQRQAEPEQGSERERKGDFPHGTLRRIG